MKKDDLYFDESLLRRIKRAEQAETAQAEPSSDREEEAEEQAEEEAEEGAEEGAEEEDEDETMSNTIKGEGGAMTDSDE